LHKSCPTKDNRWTTTERNYTKKKQEIILFIINPKEDRHTNIIPHLITKVAATLAGL